MSTSLTPACKCSMVMIQPDLTLINLDTSMSTPTQLAATTRCPLLTSPPSMTKSHRAPRTKTTASNTKTPTPLRPSPRKSTTSRARTTSRLPRKHQTTHNHTQPHRCQLNAPCSAVLRRKFGLPGQRRVACISSPRAGELSTRAPAPRHASCARRLACLTLASQPIRTVRAGPVIYATTARPHSRLTPPALARRDVCVHCAQRHERRVPTLCRVPYTQSN